MPADLAGVETPSAVSTSESPATRTPLVLTWIPTTWPPTSSS